MNHKRFLTHCILVVALAAGLAACGNNAPASRANAHADGPTGAHADVRHDGARSTVIPATVAQRAGIRTQAARAGTIADVHELQGLLTPAAGHVAQAVARFPGPVRSLAVQVGDAVRKGQVVARVESNQSLTTYAVRAPIAGIVTARHATVGAMAGAGQALVQITDLSVLWVDLHLYGTNADHIRAGATIEVARLSDGETTAATIERVLPGLATASQSTVARARIDNADGLWRPGAAVTARVTVERTDVAIAVPRSAIQTIDGKPVVFVREGDTYSARPVAVGARDARHVEIVRGLEAGEEIVVAESYLIKADLLKEGATHAH